jgi:ATP-dependent Lhr-like helicase
MLTAEFARAGALPDDLLSLCTLQLAQQYRAPSHSLRLADCMNAEGLHLRERAHRRGRRRGPAPQPFLIRAQQDGVRRLDEISATGALPIADWAHWPLNGRRQTRPATQRRPTSPPLPVPAQATPTATVYADLVAQAAISPRGIHEQLEALQTMADRLDLAKPIPQHPPVGVQPPPGTRGSLPFARRIAR